MTKKLLKIKDIEYKGHAFIEAQYAPLKMVVNFGKYYMVCNKCGGNNLFHTNWYTSKNNDNIPLRVGCNDCGNVELVEDMNIKRIK